MAKYTSIRCTHTAVSETREEVGVICDQVVIGTPGKVKSWISRKVLPVKGIRIVVFDEADEMLAQDGFAMDSLMMLKSIVSGKPPGGKDLQVLMFSATFSATVAQFALKLAGPNANKARCPPSEERRARAELAGAGEPDGCEPRCADFCAQGEAVAVQHQASADRLPHGGGKGKGAQRFHIPRGGEDGPVHRVCAHPQSSAQPAQRAGGSGPQVHQHRRQSPSRRPGQGVGAALGLVKLCGRTQV